MPEKKSGAKAKSKTSTKKSLKGGKKLEGTRLMWTIMKG